MRLLLLAALSLGASPPAHASPERFVLVRQGAFLYRDVPHAYRPARAPARRGYSAFRVVAHGPGPWRLVETLAGDDLRGHCHAEEVIAHARLRAYVHGRDLVHVLAAPADLRFSDGTGIRLGAGVALEPIEGSRWAVRADGLRFAATLPAGSVGEAYAPGPRFEDVPTARVVHLHRSLTVDGAREITLADGFGDGIRYVQEEAPHARGVLVTFRDGCAEYRAVASARALGTAPRRGSSVSYELGVAKNDRYRVRAGASLSWPDGEWAGRTERSIGVGALEPNGERSCFHLRLLGFGFGRVPARRAPRIHLCVARGDAAPSGSSDPGGAVLAILAEPAIRRTVVAEQGRLAACAPEGVAGRVLVRLLVRPDGMVGRARPAGDTTGVPGVARCVTGVLRALRFPESAGWTRVTYPITFREPPRATGAHPSD